RARPAGGSAGRKMDGTPAGCPGHVRHRSGRLLPERNGSDPPVSSQWSRQPMMRPSLTALRMPGWAAQATRSAAAGWRRLSPRERRLVQLAGALVLASFVWLVALQPALEAVRRLSGLLPGLRADAAQLDAVI